jgi:HAD superfamily hydrolase (TIGR01509 family)
VKTLQIRAVIFDLDGTLVDSRLDFAAIRREIGAPEGLGILEYIDDLPHDEAQEAAMAVVHRHEMRGAEAAAWMPGAEAVLHALHQRGTPVGIVTRNSRAAATATMARLAMPDIPLLAREDAAPKPDPAALLNLAAAWDLAPRHCAYVGDFRFDIEAARRAGMLPVLYLPSHQEPEPWARPAQILRDFEPILSWV